MIELIIVIAVLGIITAITMPQLIGFHARANQSELEQLGRDIYGAMSLVYAQLESYDHDALPDEDIEKEDEALISFKLAEVRISDQVGVEFEKVEQNEYRIKLIHKELADDDVEVTAEGVSVSWKESNQDDSSIYLYSRSINRKFLKCSNQSLARGPIDYLSAFTLS